MNGLYLCGFNDKYFNFYTPGEPWYKRFAGILIQVLMGVTLSLFYWNLSFIYWSSAQILKFNQDHYDSGENAQLLRQKIQAV